MGCPSSSNWHLYKKRLEHTHGKDLPVKIPGREDDHELAKERGLRRSQPCRDLDLKPLGSRIVRKLISPVWATQSVAMFYRNPSKLIHTPTKAAKEISLLGQKKKRTSVY